MYAFSDDDVRLQRSGAGSAHLDLESITAVNDGLIEFKGNVLFASYDHQFVQTVADRIMEILPDGSLVDKRMSYDEYLEWRASSAV